MLRQENSTFLRPLHTPAVKTGCLARRLHWAALIRVELALCRGLSTWGEIGLVLRNVACERRAVGNPFAPGAPMA